MDKQILLIDNFDSFTFNIVHLIREAASAYITVIRNDKVTEDDVKKASHVVLSPGPGIPKEAGRMPVILNSYDRIKPLLGVCLGHQAIIEHFGGTLQQLETVKHGVEEAISVDNESVLFKDLSSTVIVGRYHSWAADSKTFPSELKITATDSLGTIMAFQHKRFPIFGVQFHPESVMTTDGLSMMNHFLSVGEK